MVALYQPQPWNLSRLATYWQPGSVVFAIILLRTAFLSALI